MATPYRRSSGGEAVDTGPPRHMLQRLLDEISATSSAGTFHAEQPMSAPASIRSWSPSLPQPSSVWVGGSAVALDAREKLRAVDEARWQNGAVSVIDGNPDPSMLHSDNSRLGPQNAAIDKQASQHSAKGHQFPGPVRYPQESAQHIVAGSPLSTPARLSPAAPPHDITPSQVQASPDSNINPAPLSPLVFSDVSFGRSSSLSTQTKGSVSPTEAPTSATTVFTTEEPHTPAGIGARRRLHSFSRSTPEVSAHKRRTKTLPNIQSGSYFDLQPKASHTIIGIGGDNCRLLRDEAFVERATTPRMFVDVTTNDTLPELSSFRPIDSGFQDQPGLDGSSQKLTRGYFDLVGTASTEVPDTPAWMRPMHLVDTGGKSIYMNVHDDGPTRHSLCLWCFRAHGDFPTTGRMIFGLKITQTDQPRQIIDA
ncbi:hypothetical protein OPT61_g2961 [Boeremia exigua]|uniref:Uncharacterized protein n=1 Tax=Boeremia exigua TaxID=749465 RepID=A0ACC2IJJ3_9PLEO|nr:hypothetical protein OPT61_g2961 [Boeremia exigua]